MTPDPYHTSHGISNSMLTAFKCEIEGKEPPKASEAFAFGSLVDAMITEPHRIDWFTKTFDGEPQRKFDDANRLYNTFRMNNIGKIILQSKSINFQHISRTSKLFQYGDAEFWLDLRCKWDFFGSISGDIKTTDARTMQSFIDACYMFDYFRARAFYMDIEGTNTDYLIGLSKTTANVFLIQIKRGDKYHSLGVEQYTDLCTKWWMMKGSNCLKTA